MTVAGAITNRALVVAQDQPDPVASNNSAAAIVNGAANADVGVTKTVDRPAPSVGETVTFTVTVANAGPSPATGVVVTDALPAGLTFVSATPSQGTYTAPAWTVGTLSETGTAATATLTIVATVTAPGALVNTATVTQQTEVDPNAANNHASVTLNAAESANLTVTKALTRSSPHVGELLTFNVIVANQGPSPATGVAVTEVLSAGLAFESAEPSQGAYDPTTGVWTVGSIANTGSAGLTITARVTQAGTVTNTASVTASDQPDPDPTDNTASVTVTTETITDLAITTSLTGTAVPGQTTTYSIVVTNHGPSPVTAASVTDLFPTALVAPAWTCIADPGSSCAAASGTGNLTTTVTLEAGDRATFTVTGLIAANATGLLVNTATVTAPAGATDPDTASNTATSTVTLAPSADLHIDKAGPLNAVAGTNLVYTITVTNAGPSDAIGVTLVDPTPPGLTFVSNAGDCTTAFPCDSRHAVPRRHPHRHGDLRDSRRLYDAQSDRQHGHGVESDAGLGSGQQQCDHQHAGRVAGDRSPHHEHQRRERRGRGPADDLHHHHHQPARAERCEWRNGHRRLPDDADRGHVDVHGHGRRRVPHVGQRRHQHVRDRARGRDRRLHRHRHGRSRGHRRTRQLRAGAPAAGIRQPDFGARDRPRCHQHRGRRGNHQDGGPGLDRRGQPVGLHDHSDQHRALGRRGRSGERCHADRPGVRVECRRLHDGLPVRARCRARRRHPHHHGDLHRAARLRWAVTDRERDQCVLDDSGHEHGEQRGDCRDDAESRCRRRGHADRAVVQGVCR